ncbi:MAG: murein biosynthesis integral membrane protein MurJ [Anaerolineales bacterium]|nr:murein biosynthesis integral membrane protein MurJ [Anaerolineales bacterium]
MLDPLPAEPTPASTQASLARHAGIIALGNVTSRALGFVRDSVRAGLFGAGAHADALALAITIPNQIYDLVTGGLVNSALVPVFSEYTAPERRGELWRLAGILLTLALAVVSVFVLALVIFTPQVVLVFDALGQGNNPQAIAEAVPLLRITLPAVICLSLSGILSGLLFALKRFTYPAFTAAIFNASMVVVSLLLAGRLGVRAMAVGLLLGAAMQVALQLPGLRDGLHEIRLTFNWRHPGLRRIFKLYVPIIVVLVITQASIYLGLGLANGFVGGLSWMGYATTLYQFPLGLVAVAVSSAILPTLSRQVAAGAPEFKHTLVQGLNLVILLIVPATVGLFVLARPVVALAFERGEFTAFDTQMTAQVLRVFLLGLSFAAVDQVLIFAFYARQNTLTPALVGGLSVGVYVAVALLTLQPLGLLALMLADSAKQITHALVTGAALGHKLEGFGGTSLWPTLGKVALASAVMAGLAALTLLALDRLPLGAGLLHKGLSALIPGGVGVVAYFWLAHRLNVAEVRLVLARLSPLLARFRQMLGL